MSRPALGKNLARLLDGEPVAGGPAPAEPPRIEHQAAPSGALGKLVEGAAPQPEPTLRRPASEQPSAPAWYWYALDILLLALAELLAAFGRGIPGWLRWPAIFACVITGAGCAIWAVLQQHAPRRSKQEAALGRVIFH